MTRRELLVVIGWFALAAYVIFRCFQVQTVDLDIIFAAWSGGVLSTICYGIVWRRIGRQNRGVGPNPD